MTDYIFAPDFLSSSAINHITPIIKLMGEHNNMLCFSKRGVQVVEEHSQSEL